MEEHVELRAELEAEDLQRRVNEKKKAEEARAAKDLSHKLSKWQEMGLESVESLKVSPPKPSPRKCAPYYSFFFSVFAQPSKMRL